MIRENLLMLGASIAIAVGVRFALAPTFAPHKELEFDARLEFEGLAPTLTVVGEPSKVKVVASGSAEYLNQLDTGSVTAVVDLSYAREGERSYMVDVKAPTRSRVTILPKSPKLRLKVERVSSVSEPVDVEPSGLPPREYVYDGAAVLPPKVSVIGAASVLGSVRKVRALLDLGAVRPGVSLRLPVEILDEANRPVPYARAEPAEVTVNPAVAAAPAVRRVLVSPTWSGQPAFGYAVDTVQVRPTQLQVRGESAALARLTVLETEPVPLSGAKSNFSATVRVRLPEGVKAVGSSEVKVEVTIAPKPSTESPGP